MNFCLNPNPKLRHYRGKLEQTDPACSDPPWGQRDHHQHGSPGCSHHHRCKTTTKTHASLLLFFFLCFFSLLCNQQRILIISSVMSALCPVSYLLVHPTQRKEGGQEGTRKRADLSVVPLDTTGEGHHGGVFYGPIQKTLNVLYSTCCWVFFFFCFFFHQTHKPKKPHFLMWLPWILLFLQVIFLYMFAKWWS